MNYYRIIDANLNRASEGIRVIEDILRFYFDEKNLSNELRVVRHKIRDGIKNDYIDLIQSRDSANDVGKENSNSNNLDNKKSIDELFSANFKRAQEALRVTEEILKIINKYNLSKEYEDIRFRIYNLEKEIFLFINNSKTNCKKSINHKFYGITSFEHSIGRSNIEVVEMMINSGIKVIQYREKEKSLKEKLFECEKIREITLKNDVVFIVNDDVSIAKLVDADGVHIGQDDLPIEKVRQLIGNEKIIGLSTHSPNQANEAAEKGADYIGVGPIYRTFTKKDVCEPVGLEYLKYVVQNINIPFVAIGGIKASNLSEVIKMGAKTVALVTEIVGAVDINQKINELSKIYK